MLYNLKKFLRDCCVIGFTLLTGCGGGSSSGEPFIPGMYLGKTHTTTEGDERCTSLYTIADTRLIQIERKQHASGEESLLISDRHESRGGTFLVPLVEVARSESTATFSEEISGTSTFFDMNGITECTVGEHSTELTQLDSGLEVHSEYDYSCVNAGVTFQCKTFEDDVLPARVPVR